MRLHAGSLPLWPFSVFVLLTEHVFRDDIPGFAGDIVSERGLVGGSMFVDSAIIAAKPTIPRRHDRRNTHVL